MKVVGVDDAQRLQRGTAYIARGDFHLQVVSQGGILQTALTDSPPIHYQRPAVDALFGSAAQLQGVQIVALLLTGMGSDGAAGMLALRQAGAVTIAESEQSCVVFGMPAEAIARGGATHVASLLSMPNLIAEAFKKRPASRTVRSA